VMVCLVGQDGFRIAHVYDLHDLAELAKPYERVGSLGITSPCPRARGEPYAQLRSGRFRTIQRRRRLANHPVYKQLFCESTQSIP
jgi:hypothetical protein